MKPIAQSVALSIVASILASWLLRRLIFLAEQPGNEPRRDPASSVIVVVPVVIGNTIKGPTIMAPPRKLPGFGRRAAKHR
jgi:hypothetical protein